MAAESKVKRAYQKIVASFANDPAVTFGSDTKAFGSSALHVKGKIFAMVSSKGMFVLKLPRVQVDDLVSAGRGARFEPAKGRVMKEWVEMLEEPNVEKWTSLAKSAKDFVATR